MNFTDPRLIFTFILRRYFQSLFQETSIELLRMSEIQAMSHCDLSSFAEYLIFTWSNYWLFQEIFLVHKMSLNTVCCLFTWKYIVLGNLLFRSSSYHKFFSFYCWNIRKCTLNLKKRSPLYFRHLTAASSNPEHNSQINPIITNSKAQKIRDVASPAFNPQLNTESYMQYLDQMRKKINIPYECKYFDSSRCNECE